MIHLPMRTGVFALICMLTISGMHVPAQADEYGYLDEYGNYIEYEQYQEENWEEEYVEENPEDWEDSENSEDEGAEEEFIPEAYYDPILTNGLEGWPDGPMIQAAGAVVMDLDTGIILYAKNMDQEYYPASITKIMTCLVALKYGNLEDTIVCPDEVFDLEEDASHLGFVPGEKVSMKDALYGLMLQSANDLGNAIAIHMAGSIEGFAQMMNDEAQALGCTHTHFANPHGLHMDDHYTCARDMALIAQEAYRLDMFRQIIATTESSIAKTNKTKEVRYFENHHKMILDYTDHYVPWCTGGKTGFTDQAWNTLVTYGEQNDLRLVCVLLRENGPDRAYEETTQLLEYGFANFRHADVTQPMESPTFYDLMDIGYAEGSKIIERSPLLEQKVMQITRPGIVTVPNDLDVNALTIQTGEGGVKYTWQGWEVGRAELSITPFPQNVHFSYEQERDMEQLLKDSEKERQMRQLQKTAHRTREIVENYVTEKANSAKEYVDNHKLLVLLAGGFLLIILIILLIIVYLRCTRETRIMRRRALEERTRQRHAEEIEQMSALEIEEELRMAMEDAAKPKDEDVDDFREGEEK